MHARRHLAAIAMGAVIAVGVAPPAPAPVVAAVPPTPTVDHDQDRYAGEWTLIFYAIPAFVRDNLFFARDLLLTKHKFRHAFALKLHDEVDAIGRHGFVIEGPIDPRCRVRLGPVLFKLSVELTRLVVLGFFEHKMLKKMRKTGFPMLLVARTDFVPGVVAHNGGAGVSKQEDLKSVRQAMAPDRESTELFFANKLDRHAREYPRERAKIPQGSRRKST